MKSQSVTSSEPVQSWRDDLHCWVRNDGTLLRQTPVDTNDVERMKTALERERHLLRMCHRHLRHLEDRVHEQTVVIRRAHEETIYRLVAASMYRDKETGEHIRRVGLMSAVLAEAAGWTADWVEQIRMAAPMHDVGKIGIPDSILRKPAALAHDEWDTMERHTLIGSQLLKNSHSPMLQMAHAIALSHHERWDGTGYPAGLAGVDIPEAARIVAIVDVFDALTHDRVYRPALPTQTAIDSLRKGRGSHFDPELVDLFLTQLPDIKSVLRDHPDAPAASEAPVADPADNHCLGQTFECLT